MHFAKLSSSARLQRVLDALREAGRDGLTTLDIVQRAKVCAVNSIVAELRANGVEVSCECEGVGRFRYRLVSDGSEDDIWQEN